MRLPPFTATIEQIMLKRFLAGGCDVGVLKEIPANVEQRMGIDTVPPAILKIVDQGVDIGREFRGQLRQIILRREQRVRGSPQAAQ
jgi:hypothetical protein